MRVRWVGLPRQPWFWALALLAPLALVPAIDIAVSRLFFLSDQHIFLLRSHPFGEFVRKTLPVILFAVAGGFALLGVAAGLRRRPLLGVSPRSALFVVLALALGPGLVVNVVFKDNWGRPRPSTIAEFGGPNHYVSPLLPSDQCPDNCSFPSGHASLGFWLVAPALLAPVGQRRRWVAAALAFGLAVGVVRIAQGGHFLSDVAFSGVMVTGLSQWLKRLILGDAERARENNHHPVT